MPPVHAALLAAPKCRRGQQPRLQPRHLRHGERERFRADGPSDTWAGGGGGVHQRGRREPETDEAFTTATPDIRGAAHRGQARRHRCGHLAFGAVRRPVRQFGRPIASCAAGRWSLRRGSGGGRMVPAQCVQARRHCYRVGVAEGAGGCQFPARLQDRPDHGQVQRGAEQPFLEEQPEGAGCRGLGPPAGRRRSRSLRQDSHADEVRRDLRC
mmetsp:Transcript_98828/g.137232  ORF Transcript_98828/g.137232 Transcript_98828/m.137232 type:complete len:212 (-) Transcript_98828:2059-2694(-)